MSLRTILVAVLVALVLACGWPSSEESLPPALVAYEDVRSALARDDLSGARDHSRELAEALASADFGTPAHREAAAAAALEVAGATDAEAARVAFGDVSRPLVAAVAEDPRLRDSMHLFTCPMAKGFGQWVQPDPGISNPYMGTAMPTCGSAAAWEEVRPHVHDGDPDAIAYWTCSMHPSVKEAEQGLCPICSMDLTPVRQQELVSGAVVVDAPRRQRFGVRTARVEQRTLNREVRATGQVVWDEDGLTVVNSRTEVWVERVLVDEPGTAVVAGQPLAVLYSPELYAAGREWLASRGSAREASARRRLALFGLTEGQIASLATRGAQDTSQLLAPSSGVLIEKHVVDGDHIQPGQPMFRLGRLDRVWVEAEVYEDDLGVLTAGAAVSLQALGRTDPIPATLDTFQPWIDPTTRRATVRSVVDNTAHGLIPGQFVEMTLSVPSEPTLAVPVDAVIFTGERRIVFVTAPEDRLVPRDVKLGPRAGPWFAVEEGLAAGDTVVASGTFLIAAESRIRAAQTFWGRDGTD